MSRPDPIPSIERNPVEMLAEEFVERQRRGERPSLTEYTGRYPELAEEIRDLFPALVMMEQLKPAGQGTGGPIGDRPAGLATPSVRRRGGWATTACSGKWPGAAWGSSTRPCRSRWAATWP